jgi:hypothetical protein
MRILITSPRMPFALDAIRKLGEGGHEVFARDSYEASPGNHSRYLAEHFTTASPSGDPEQFAADVERIAGENEIELVLPMFEEVLRKQLFVAVSDGIIWDGQPIPGLPPGVPPIWLG